MSPAAVASGPAASRWRDYLLLGRVSNLPTVWTNTLAGAALSGADAGPGQLALLALAFSLLYTGGMYLNDAFDRDVDRRERPERPIPAGRIGAGRVFRIGYALLAGGVLVVAVGARGPGGGGIGAVGAGILLAGVITAYDAWHKANPLSPVVMGLCRVLVYVTAALAVSGRVAPGGDRRGGRPPRLPDRPHVRGQAGEPRRGPEPLAARAPGGALRVRGPDTPGRRRRGAPLSSASSGGWSSR